MKLSHYARQQGISYRTAFRWWKAGLVPGSQTATGTMIVTDHEAEARSPRKVAIYARVSSEAVWQDPAHAHALESRTHRWLDRSPVRE
jgi:predicted site-specific integrase-resolvase